MFNIKSFFAKISGNMTLSEQKSDQAPAVDKPANSVFESGELLGVGDDLVLNNKNNSYPLGDDPDVRAKAKFIEKKLKKIRNKRTFNYYDMTELLKLSMEDLKRISELFYIENREKQFNGFDIVYLAQLSDEELERAKTLFYVENRKYQFSGGGIALLAQLSDEELERAKTLFYVENRKYQFSGGEIALLAQLSDEELECAKTLFHVENRKYQFDGYDIAQLAKLSDKEYDWAKENLFTADISNNLCVQIAKYPSDDILEYLKNHEIKKYNDRTDNLELIDKDGSCYIFDKTGLIETIEKNMYKNEIKNVTVTNVFNKKLNLKQELLSDTEIKAFSEVLTYYDDEGNVIKTVKLKRNPENGFLTVSETDKYGNQIPIQWESVDPDTGAKITERHLTSPDGTKTEFYAEESDNLRITDYEIIDKNGNRLINVHQTFQKISENKFISSINVTGNPEDTQIYEMEYTDNNIVIIFDKKNNKTTEIDLKQYLKDEVSIEKLMPIIKQLPGHVLLEFEEKPLNIVYNPKIEGEKNNDAQNASWSSYLQQLIVGNYENTIKEDENMLGAITHELGHYLDDYVYEDKCKYSNNPKVLEIYNEELKNFQVTTTTEQQRHIDYFINGLGDDVIRGNHEKIAETHAILYSNDSPLINVRRFYFAQYFPRTMAAIMKLLLEEEGVCVK